MLSVGVRRQVASNEPWYFYRRSVNACIRAHAQLTESLPHELGVRGAEVLPQGMLLASRRTIAAELVLWAARVKAPDLLKGIASLESKQISRLHVRHTLQTTPDDCIFELGDCATGTGPDKCFLIPSRTQTGRQVTIHLVAGRPDPARPARAISAATPATEFRLPGFARQVQRRWQHDERPDQQQHDDRKKIHLADVPSDLQGAQAGAAGLFQGGAGHAGASHSTPHRAVRKTALSSAA